MSTVESTESYLQRPESGEEASYPLQVILLCAIAFSGGSQAVWKVAQNQSIPYPHDVTLFLRQIFRTEKVEMGKAFRGPWAKFSFRSAYLADQPFGETLLGVSSFKLIRL